MGFERDFCGERRHGGVLTGAMIRRHLDAGTITIDPAPAKIGPNSVDLTLAPELLVYAPVLVDRQAGDLIEDVQTGPPTTGRPLDMRAPTRTRGLTIPDEGLVLSPGVLYLGRTVERTYTPHHVPYIGGRSSVGRLGVFVHATAGFGDVGFDGTWTLEITVVHPVRVYPRERVCQLWLFETSGEIEETYEGRYQGQTSVTPSKMHEPTKEK